MRPPEGLFDNSGDAKLRASRQARLSLTPTYGRVCLSLNTDHAHRANKLCAAVVAYECTVTGGDTYAVAHARDLTAGHGDA